MPKKITITSGYLEKNIQYTFGTWYIDTLGENISTEVTLAEPIPNIHKLRLAEGPLSPHISAALEDGNEFLTYDFDWALVRPVWDTCEVAYNAAMFKNEWFWENPQGENNLTISKAVSIADEIL